MLQIKSKVTSNQSDLALVISTNSIEDATAQLDFIQHQIKKRTPVKFKAVDYQGHQINFLSIKGFFKMLFGGKFNEFDKPYFTTIDDYVVFSDNPNTLKSMIADFEKGETLVKSEEFVAFNHQFDDESSLFVYSNSPLVYDYLYAFADATTKSNMHKNKDYLICFPQVGFQLTPKDNLFETKLITYYQDPAVVKKILFMYFKRKSQNRNQFLELKRN